MAIVMLTNLKESLIVASNRFLQKCPVTHILVRIARSAHSFFSLFRSRRFDSIQVVLGIKYHMHVYIWRLISVSVLSGCLLAWLLFFPMFLWIFHFSSAGQWQCFIDRLSACIAHYASFFDATHHTISMKVIHVYFFFRPESHARREEKVRTHIYAKLK